MTLDIMVWEVLSKWDGAEEDDKPRAIFVFFSF